MTLHLPAAMCCPQRISLLAVASSATSVEKPLPTSKMRFGFSSRIMQ